MLETGFIAFVALGLMTMAFVALALTPLFPSFRPNRNAISSSDFARNPRRLGLELRRDAQEKEPARIRAHLHLGDYEQKTPLTLADSVYVQGHASIPSHSELKALAADRSIVLGSDVSINDWIDAAGHIRAGEHCSLGSYATSLGSITLGPKTSFKNLSALPIRTESHTKPPLPSSTSHANWQIGKQQIVIPAGATVKQELIAEQSIFIGRGAILEKPVRSSAHIILEEGVVSLSDLQAEGTIHIGPNCHLCGPILAEKKIYIGSGTTIGSPDATQTVYGARGVKLEGNVSVYGQIMTETTGQVV